MTAIAVECLTGAPLRALKIAAVFNVEDSAERFMAETMQRFHSEAPGLYSPIAMKRVTNDKGERVVLEIARFQPQRRRAPPQWLAINWNVDEISIRFEWYQDHQAALAAITAA